MPPIQDNGEELGKGDPEEEEDLIDCIPNHDSVNRDVNPEVDDNEGSIPDLVPEIEGRPSRNVGPPERYDPSLESSYSQLVECHNLVNSEESIRTLKYEKAKTKVFANLTFHYRKQ